MNWLHPPCSEYRELTCGLHTVQDLVERQGIPVFADIQLALQATTRVPAGLVVKRCSHGLTAAASFGRTLPPDQSQGCALRSSGERLLLIGQEGASVRKKPPM